MAFQIGVVLFLVTVTWYVYGIVTQRTKRSKGPPSVPYYLPFGLDNVWELIQVSLLNAPLTRPW
jgi:hypothetical protein